jgi:hypothetical protein
MSIKRETIIISLICLYILSYGTILVESYKLVSYGIKLIVIFSICALAKGKKLSTEAVAVILLYTLLLIYGLLIGTINGKFVFSSELSLKYGLRILAFAAILIMLSSGQYSNRILKAPIWIGVVLAIQSILLFILIYLGVAPAVTYVDHARGSLASFGILGYAPHITQVAGGPRILRVSSFFSEASVFARFLEYPIILSLGYYRIYRRKSYLIFLMICSLAFVLTFSWTGYLSLLLGYCGFTMLRKKGVAQKVVVFAGAILVVFLLHVYLKAFYIPNPNERTTIQHVLLSKYADALRSTENIRGIYGGRVYSAVEATKIWLEEPFGVGLMNNTEIEVLKKHGSEGYSAIHLYGGFWFWLVTTGFVGITIFILILMCVLKRSRMDRFDKMDIRRYILIAFITVGIHEALYGYWIDPMFLFIMALVLEYKEGSCVLIERTC